MNIGRFWVALPKLRLPRVSCGRLPDETWYFWCGSFGFGLWSRAKWRRRAD